MISGASETKYRLLFENMEEGFVLAEIITDESGKGIDVRFLEANKAADRHTGLDCSQIAGMTMRELWPLMDQHHIDAYINVGLTGEPADLEHYSQTFGRHVRMRAFCPQRGQVAAIIEDITERVQAEEAVRIQHDLSQALSACDDLHEAMQLILDAALDIEGLDSGGIYLADASGALDLVAHRGLSPEFIRMVTHYPPDSPHAIMTRAGQARYGMFEDVRTSGQVPDNREGLRALAVVPVLYQGQLLAVFNLASHTHDVIPPARAV